jgi:uncharacterized protein YndB with AHSA1/START domain
MKKEAIRVSTTIPAAPTTLYYAWLSPEQHSAMTNGAAAKIDPTVGAKFTALNGTVSGKLVILDLGRRLVMAWRTAEFPRDAHDSRVEIHLEALGGSTRVTLIQTEIPEGLGEKVRAIWNDEYFGPMRNFFSKFLPDPRNPPPPRRPMPPPEDDEEEEEETPPPAKAAKGKPASAKPVTAKPASAKPVTAKPVTAKPASAKPVTAKPVSPKPVSPKPVTAKPAPPAPKPEKKSAKPAPKKAAKPEPKKKAAPPPKKKAAPPPKKKAAAAPAKAKKPEKKPAKKTEQAKPKKKKK